LRRVLVPALLILAVGTALWIGWAEDHPREERRLRQLVQERLLTWFPEQMAPDPTWHGLHPRVTPSAPRRIGVVLIHGLDEPGTLWEDLVPRLEAAGFPAWELRYPNDQGIDRSADYLATLWPGLPAERPLVLIGHSMGGLVARDFVSRWRHPVGAAAGVEGPPVAGVILAGTPNQGSEWARLRVWLELRDQFPTVPGRRYSLFAALRDGTGAAKVDLRPGSDFLQGLNARPWPDSVPIRLIGGRLVAPPETWVAGLDAIFAETGSQELKQQVEAWWSGVGDGLGDGAVSLESLRIPGGPEPLLVDAAHRTMLARLLASDPEPPAISVILATLEIWEGEGPRVYDANDHGARATPEDDHRGRHGRFPHPGPLPEGEGEKERAGRDFHGKP
jgi:pimeloyl-ACP methyl ester carboxylesterase